MSNQTSVYQVAERVEQLLVRYEELQRANQLLSDQVVRLAVERDTLTERIDTARLRIDTLLEQLHQAFAAGKTNA